MGFSRQEYWSGLSYPPPGDLPDPGIEPESLRSNLHWQVGSLPLAPPGKSQRERYLGSTESSPCSTQRSLHENQGAWTVGAHSLWIIAGSLSHPYQIYQQFQLTLLKNTSRIRPFFHYLHWCHPDLTTLMRGVKKVKDLNCRKTESRTFSEQRARIPLYPTHPLCAWVATWEYYGLTGIKTREPRNSAPGCVAKRNEYMFTHKLECECSQQCRSQKPKSRNNPNGHQLMHCKVKCGTSIQWNTVL